MNRLMIAGSVSLALMFVLLWLLLRPAPVLIPNDPATQAAPPLMVYCAASSRPVMEVLRADFAKETGAIVEVQYGPSQGLLAGLEISRTGDLYLPADDSYIRIAREKGLLTNEQPVAEMQVVVAVRSGNPLRIGALSDLLRDDVRLVQANPDLAAIGLLTREALAPAGKWDSLAARTTSFRTNVNEAANDVLVGAADAAISYDVVVQAMNGLEAVSLPEFEKVQAQVVAAQLTFSQQPDLAGQFLAFLASAPGQQRYREFGFHPLPAGPSEKASP